MSDEARLETAFRYHVVEAMIEADGQLFRNELAALSALDAPMKEHGLMDAHGVLTPAYKAARTEALRRLGTLLDHDRQVQLVQDFLAVADVDGVEDDGEMATLFAAMGALKFSQDELNEIVKEHRAGLTDTP